MSAVRQAIRRLMVGTDGTAGSALVEFTIFAPLLVMISIYMMDFGLLIWRKIEVHHAAQAGAHYALVHNYDSASIQSAVTNATTFTISASPAPIKFYGCPSSSSPYSLTSVVQNSACSDGSVAGTYVTVSAQSTAPYKSFVSYGLVSSSWGNLTAQATVRIQ
jgi:Flp pilus assembly protein TadG